MHPSQIIIIQELKNLQEDYKQFFRFAHKKTSGDANTVMHVIGSRIDSAFRDAIRYQKTSNEVKLKAVLDDVKRWHTKALIHTQRYGHYDLNVALQNIPPRAGNREAA